MLLKEKIHYIYYMTAQRNFVILIMYQIEQMSIVEIYNYFEGTIHIDYITDLINKANNDENILMQFYMSILFAKVISSFNKCLNNSFCKTNELFS